jgi:glycosyltransferase involved in cell wall biosynthesis
LRIAIVHDALCVSGGAERLVLWIAKAFPKAPIFTSVYLPENTFAEFKSLDVRTMPFAGMIKSERQFKLLYPLWYLLIQRPDFKEFDFVLSSSTYLAKFIRPAPTVRHACYLYAPFRLLWKPESYSADSLPTRGAATGLVNRVIPLLRKWDLKRTKTIPKLATSCRNMADEIMKVYGMEAEVIYPPVEIPQTVTTEQREDYYLSVSRLISHKRVDLSVQACTRLGKNLVVVGDGPEREKLAQMAGSTIRFAGRVSDEALQDLYRKAKGLLFPSYEDYGIVPLEAQAWGVPVIAFGRGGSLETIKEGVSGIFFEEQEVDSLAAAINLFESTRFNVEEMRQWVAGFDVASFTAQIRKFVQQD